MMAQIMAQNASSALLQAQAKSALQAQSAVTLPMSLSLSTPAFPAINPAISLPSLSNPQMYQSILSSAAILDRFAQQVIAPSASDAATPNVAST
jgi:hypothetical protein